MKILFCKTGFAGPISGADEVAVMYALELQRAGHSTALLLVHPPAADDILAVRLREANVPLTALASPTFSSSMATARKVAIRVMRAFKPASQLILKSRELMFNVMDRYRDACCAYLVRERPDVVHVLTPDQGAMMFIRAAHRVGVPVVYQEVGLPFHPPGFERVYERFTWVLPLCARVAVLSPLLAHETHRALPQVEFPSVLPLMSHDVRNGVQQARSAHQPVRFGFAGRLEYLKGPLQLVEAFRLLHAIEPNIELRIAGDGSQRQEIVDTLRHYGLENKCRFFGIYNRVAERSQFMGDLDVFVLPSLTEGTPNAIIEAMAHHKPIVATRVGGIPDLVSSEVGVLVPPSDPRSLSDALAKLTTDVKLRQAMGVAARKRYEELFTPQAVLPLLIDFYERVSGQSEQSNTGRISPAHPWWSFNGSH
ncbi:MAG: glycosyltransferase family 4 protein [Acidobacteria bacterium]|nr:glycosyltransferase family 4 protein [Acidobacteriota bacterium]